jgi:tol-pal system protein YbgF
MNRKLWIASAAMAVLLIADGSAMAQTRRAEGPPLPPPAIEWDKKRLSQLERNVRKLEAQLARGNRDPNAPPTIIEPDPEVIALQAQVRDLTDKLTDMEGTVRNVSGDMERTTFELARAKQEAADARAALDPLRQRLSDMDARLAALEQAGTAPAGEEANLGDPQVDFDAAMKLMNDQAYTEAGAAFQAFIAKWPDAPQTPEAHYRLGESLYVRDEAALAAQSYARALKGWPTARWAAEATLKLATSLANVGRNAEACAAVVEFNKRYAPTSSANAKNRAASIKTRAKCA